MAIPTHHAPIFGHSTVARIGSIHAHALQPIKNHVLFNSADEIEGTLLAAALPVSQVDSGLVINHENALSLGHPLPKSLGLDSFERAHVVLVEPFASHQMLEGV